MVTHHDHRRREPRSPAQDQGGAHGDHGMFAMLACCIAIGAAFLLIALGVF